MHKNNSSTITVAPIGIPAGASMVWKRNILTLIGNNTNKKKGVSLLNNKPKPLITSRLFKNGMKYPEPNSPVAKAVACGLMAGCAIFKKG